MTEEFETLSREFESLEERLLECDDPNERVALLKRMAAIVEKLQAVTKRRLGEIALGAERS